MPSTDLDILALLLLGALGLVVADLLLHRVTDLLGNLPHHIVALSLCGGGALLLRHVPGRDSVNLSLLPLQTSPGGGFALLVGNSGAVLASLSPGAGDDLGGAGGVGDGPAGGAGHRVVHSPALRLVAHQAVTVVRLGLGRGEGERQETGQEQELGQSCREEIDY